MKKRDATELPVILRAALVPTGKSVRAFSSLVRSAISAQGWSDARAEEFNSRRQP